MRHDSFVLVTAVALGLGCCPDLMEDVRDTDAALRLAYDPRGLPAFEGQAILIRGCAAEGRCHGAPGTSPSDDNGNSLLDLNLAAVGRDYDEDASAQLLAAQLYVLEHRSQVYGIALQESPHPDAESMAAYRDAAPVFSRTRDGRTLEPLPTLESAEGREILRNYLVSGVPVVGRTERRAGLDSDFFTAPVCDTGCVDPTWPSIYADAIVPGCTTGGCHDESAAGGLDLVTGGAAGVFAREADRVVPWGSTRGPLLRGSEPALGWPTGVWHDERLMDPLTWTGQRECVLNEWALCGSCVEEDGGTCATCIEEARVTCGLVEGESAHHCAGVRCEMTLAD